MSERPQAVGILGVGAAAPERVLTNHDLEKIVETSDEWIRSRTGIAERRIVCNGQSTGDLGAEAARNALKSSGLSVEDIDLIICATCSPDETMPATSCRIQNLLGAAGQAAFDINAACTGFVYALSVANTMIRCGTARRALVIGADALTTFLDFQDRNTCVLFGDGAGAVVVGPVAPGKGILGEFLAADGRGGDLLTVPAGGARKPASADTVARREHYIAMDGREIFKFAVRVLGECVEKALEKTPFSIEDIDYVVPHQANIRIIDAAAKRLKLPRERFICNLDRYGNTSGASIPLALAEAAGDGRLTDGKLVALSAFGAGLTWGGTILRWGK